MGRYSEDVFISFMKKISLLIILILLLDQIVKIYIKTHFPLHNSLEILPFFKLTFVENPGMAYGLQFGGLLGKYALILLRLVVIIVMVFTMKKWLKQGVSMYRLLPFAMIFAGALGNLIDGMFYGMIFSSGTVYNPELQDWIGYSGISQITPFGKGYSEFMKGCVVDMFHFPLFTYEWNGEKHEFFSYIFNVADSAITVGGILLFLFRKKAFPNGFEL